MKSRVDLHALHILECIEKIQRYRPKTMEGFIEDEVVYYATLRWLQTLAESTKFIDVAIKEQNLHIPWDDIWGFRNILVHDYLGDLIAAELWDIIIVHLPILQHTIEKYYPNWKQERAKQQDDLMKGVINEIS